MKHKAVRIALFAIEALIGLGAIEGGMLLAAAAIFTQHEWAALLSALMGIVMLGFEIFEVVIIDRHPEALVTSSLSQQALMSILGLIIFGLASYLWMSEYRRQHLPTTPVSHA